MAASLRADLRDPTACRTDPASVTDSCCDGGQQADQYEALRRRGSQGGGSAPGARGLAEFEFANELIVSELVTNAIRYGSDPIQLRIRADALVREVSDGSSTAPLLRRARVHDEGGRGLLLVAQVAECWGSRQISAGKTIWAEQPLPDERPGEHDSSHSARSRASRPPEGR